MGGDPSQPPTRKLLGYMPQGGGLYPDLTVEDNLRIFGEGAGLRPGSDVEKVLEFLELRKRRQEVVGTLAMGWQKRVSLGAALITQAPVLLLDEPLAHADAPFTAKAWAHFHELAGQGRTVIVATSAPHMAVQAQRVAIMRAGRLAAEHETAAIATPGRARVVLTYQKRSATRTQEVDVQDYRQELVRLVQGGEERPFEVERLTQVELRSESPVERLSRLLTEET
jgi:ABC-2 type transport system ATP-binding protein